MINLIHINMQISYLGPRIQGASSTFQEWNITPLSSNQYWNANDVIKIMGNVNQGLVDFYRSHIEYTVEVNQEMQPIGGIQIDSSAQSIISQMVLQSGQQQVERIQEYDTLAAMLSDLGFAQTVCMYRQGQGLGYSNIPTNLAPVTSNGRGAMLQSYFVNPQNVSSFGTYQGTSYGFTPTSAPTCPPIHHLYPMGSGLNPNQENMVTSNNYAGLLNTNNYVIFPVNNVGGTPTDIFVKDMGRGPNMRAQYVAKIASPGYPDGTTTTNLNGAILPNPNGRLQYDNMRTVGFDPKIPYAPTFKTMGQDACGINGYNKAYVGEFCTGSNEPIISATIPQCQMKNGKLLDVPVPIFKKTFRVPLISAICGILIPPDQFQLIPTEAVKNILLQITLNPFAFFTTGYSDIHEYDSYGMGIMQKRNWLISSFQWVWHLYTFNDANIRASIQTKLYQGIKLSTTMWQLCAQYQLPNGSYVRNNYQIPANVASLGQIAFIFYSNQFQTKTFCRKHFRLSNNITSFQLKANGNYYPLQPISGNAGNPQALDVTGDNWNFYQLLLLSNNFLFNTNFPMPRINQKNFAINGRCYDTTRTQPLFSPQTLYDTNTSSYAAIKDTIFGATQKSINAHTALGQSFFHENRYIGKGFYSYTFEPYGHSKGMTTGLDTRGYRQFDVIFNNSPNDIYPNDQTLYIFIKANAIVTYTPNGILVNV